ncbi:hypothetical protein C8F01DRAFT_1245306 [Mycena amicta]|nr:hypothetical protein C8F01DRAFT_1245306 [Mycena amicta]
MILNIVSPTLLFCRCGMDEIAALRHIHKACWPLLPPLAHLDLRNCGLGEGGYEDKLALLSWRIDAEDRILRVLLETVAIIRRLFLVLQGSRWMSGITQDPPRVDTSDWVTLSTRKVQICLSSVPRWRLLSSLHTHSGSPGHHRVTFPASRVMRRGLPSAFHPPQKTPASSSVTPSPPFWPSFDPTPSSSFDPTPFLLRQIFRPCRVIPHRYAIPVDVITPSPDIRIDLRDELYRPALGPGTDAMGRAATLRSDKLCSELPRISSVSTGDIRVAGPALDLVTIVEEDIAQLAKREVNGRQIKDAARTAHSLAVAKEAVGFGHMLQTLDAMDEFSAQFEGMRAAET